MTTLIRHDDEEDVDDDDDECEYCIALSHDADANYFGGWQYHSSGTTSTSAPTAIHNVKIAKVITIR